MTLEISLRPPFSLPRLFRAQSDGPEQEYHWVGQNQKSVQGNTGQEKQDNAPKDGKDKGAYRPLSSITLGEVDETIHLFDHQLIPAHENWIGKNCFCTLPLKRIRDGRPPMVFGRVKTCYPSDGYLENIEDIELLFPRKDAKPDILLLHKDDISRYSQRSAQSYYVCVRFKASEQDAVDFAGADPLFSTNGFVPEFDSGFYDLLEMNDQNQSAYPWLYVVGSRWFDAIPESVHGEVKAKLEKMLHWGKRIFNYHPDWLPKEVNTLNRVLGYKYEFTPALLTEPANPQETAFIVAKFFDQIFMSSIPE